MAIQTLAGEALLRLYLHGTTVANIAVNATSSPATNLYLSLHTGDPSAAGNTNGYQSYAECNYTSYARVTVARTSGGWTIAAGATSATLAAIASFPEAGAGTTAQTAQYFGVGTAASGDGRLLFSGPISPNISIIQGITPQLGTSTAIQVS